MLGFEIYFVLGFEVWICIWKRYWNACTMLIENGPSIKSGFQILKCLWDNLRNDFKYLIYIFESYICNEVGQPIQIHYESI